MRYPSRVEEFDLGIERYRIVRLLGQGGAGRVYAANDELLGRPVAIKVLNESSGRDASVRLLAEARAAAALKHPNVVAIYDVGEARGATYIVMELVDGKPLRAFIGDRGITLRSKLRWLLGVARALETAHAAGLVHRDIKPENILIGTDREPRILDFGIATQAPRPIDVDAETVSTRGKDAVAERFEHAGRAVGTLVFMAPEQLRGDAVDGRADQFAWGITAYELLTGVHPWSTLPSTAMSIEEALFTAQPRPLTSVLSDLPRWLDPIVERALEKEPARRFASMRDVADLLEEHLTAEPTGHEVEITTNHVGDGSRDLVHAKARSHRWVALALVGAGLFVVATAIVFVSQHRVAASSASRAASAAPSATASSPCAAGEIALYGPHGSPLCSIPCDGIEPSDCPTNRVCRGIGQRWIDGKMGKPARYCSVATPPLPCPDDLAPFVDEHGHQYCRKTCDEAASACPATTACKGEGACFARTARSARSPKCCGS